MRKVILCGMLGNGLEWYDYALYAHMVPVFSKLFFPAGNEGANLLATFAIFAVGFIARPAGGILFGVLGDRFGRRTSLAISIVMMAIPTGCIGLLPTYAQAGLVAPLLLVLIRILQGLSLGGAYSGSMTFVVEHAPPDKRGAVGSAVMASLVIGFLLGSLVTMLIKFSTTTIQFEAWGWRLPFLLGIIIGFVGYYVRHACDESPVYVEATAGGHLSKTPVRDVMTHHPVEMLRAIGIYLSVTIPFYVVSAYMLTYTEHTLLRSKDQALMLNTLNMSLMLLGIIPSGWLSDRIGRKKLLMIVAACFAALSYPLFRLMTPVAPLVQLALAQGAFAFLEGLYIAPVAAVLVELFPTRVRYTGVALSYNISAAAFGGTAPMVCEWLLQKTGGNAAIAGYIMLGAMLTLVAFYGYRDKWKEVLA